MTTTDVARVRRVVRIDAPNNGRTVLVAVLQVYCTRVGLQYVPTATEGMGKQRIECPACRAPIMLIPASVSASMRICVLHKYYNTMNIPTEQQLITSGHTSAELITHPCTHTVNPHTHCTLHMRLLAAITAATTAASMAVAMPVKPVSLSTTTQPTCQALAALIRSCCTAQVPQAVGPVVWATWGLLGDDHRRLWIGWERGVSCGMLGMRGDWGKAYWWICCRCLWWWGVLLWHGVSYAVGM